MRLGAPHVALLGLAALALPIAPAMAAHGPLVARYADLGGEYDGSPVSDPIRPLLLPSHRGAAAEYPLRMPAGVAVAPDGSVIVAETATNRILRVRGDRVTILAGRVYQREWSRANAATRIEAPEGVGVAPDGTVLVAEGGGWWRVTSISPAGVLRRITLGLETSAFCVRSSPDGSLLVTDRFGNRVVRKTGTAWAVVAGSGRPGFGGDGGSAATARLDGPTCAAPAADGAVLVADAGNHRIRRIAPDGTISTVAGTGSAAYAGDGSAATATGMSPYEVLPLPDGGMLVSDPASHRVLRIAPDGVVTTFAGTGEAGSDGDGGPAAAARLWSPRGLARADDGGVVVSDAGSQTVRRITPDGTITTILGAPPQPAARSSAATAAAVPSRRRVDYWILGARGTSDEAASGRLAVIADRGTAGGVTTALWVVRGREAFRWDNREPEMTCWSLEPRAVTDEERIQPDDLAAAAGAVSVYAPGMRFAPDLGPGRLVLARSPVQVAVPAEFGIPRWATDGVGEKIVEHLIDPRSGRVVAMQVWGRSGIERIHRIRALPPATPLRMPSTRPRGGWSMNRTQTASTFRCAGTRYPGSVRFGDPSGVALARAASRRLAHVDAIAVTVRGTSWTGRPFTAASVFALRRGVVAHGVTRSAGPRTTGDPFHPGGRAIWLDAGGGGRFTRALGARCWLPVDDFESEVQRPAPIPLAGAYFGVPSRHGRLLVLPALAGGLETETLLDHRDLRIVAVRWRAAGGAHGVARFRPARPPQKVAPRRICRPT